MNINIRRRVKYRLCDMQGFEPDSSENSLNTFQAIGEKKDGWFHCWTQICEKDSKSDNYLIKAYAVIETEDHNLVELPIQWFRFLEDE